MRLRQWTMALALALVAVGSTGCVVTVQDGGDRGDRRMQNEGWVKLGERMVNGKADRDRILVGRVDGKFRRVMINVEHSSLEMYDMVVVFSDGSSYSPKLQHRFAEGARSRAIDLPGDRRVIKEVVFKYGNLPGGGAAQIELWGMP